MKYKLYEYELADRRNRLVAPDRHYEIFRKSIGIDDAGRFARYRGRDDAVLMNVRKTNSSSSDFIGLIGRHSTEREITKYDQARDEADNIIVSDDDYPNSPFVCMPRLKMIACVDGAKLRADSAMARLHAILLSRQDLLFSYESTKAAYDLRRAITNFRVFEVDFEIRPVNPHSEELGLELDEDRKRDHIRNILGKAKANKGDKLELNGGFLTAVQQLQKSGHATAGYKAETSSGVQISVPKPRRESVGKLEDEVSDTTDQDLQVDFVGMKQEFPMPQEHVTELRTIAKHLSPGKADGG
ncbi:hypothetical protein HHL25_05800 [Rhizobium sp. S-51]|uniref:Uncharacterized protein n=1 Tax=Rhizobium terricola TaxID=2728849 RepID=A0A7Y0AUB4_9HYPH|nr:hypothetical protein [Rhizobium terricola]NML73638.1 hypothetical protein [Rhizobium terricola]